MTNYAFFPLLPWIMRIGFATSTNPFIWGFIASNLCFLAGLIAFFYLSRIWRDERFATWATWIGACFPGSIYASLAYTDGILFGLATCAALAAVRRRWWLAGAISILAALDRPQGIFVAGLVVMIALVASDYSWRDRVRWAAIGGVPGVAAYIGFLAWLQAAHGSWQLNFQAEAAWGRTSPGIHMFWQQIRQMLMFPINHPLTDVFKIAPIENRVWPANVRDFIAAIGCCVLIVILMRTRGPFRLAWVVFSALVILTPLATATWGSELRYSIVAFPLLWPIAAWLSRSPRWVTITLCALLMPVTVGLFASLHAASP
jgi:hypothetical protein